MKAVYVLLGALMLVFAGCVQVQSAGKYDDFAKCLTQNGVKMYGAFWCPHCNNMKALFGSSFKYIDYIECSLPDRSGQTEICNNAKIESYPTWEFSNGTRITGEQTVVTLGEKSGCDLALIKT